MKEEFNVSRRAAWLGVFIIGTVWISFLVRVAFYFWG
jgi:hypothetical protein